MAESSSMLVNAKQNDSNNLTAIESNLSALVSKLRVTNFIVSGLALALLIASEIIIKLHILGGGFLASSVEAIRNIDRLILGSLVVSATHFVKVVNYESLWNVVIDRGMDLVLGLGITISSIKLIDLVLPSGWCAMRSKERYTGQSPEMVQVMARKCEDWMPVLQSVMVAAMVFAGIVGAIRLALAIFQTQLQASKPNSGGPNIRSTLREREIESDSDY